MKPTNNQNESTKAPLLRVLKLEREEFQQSFAVAELAVKLCELTMTSFKVPLERENPAPEKFLAKAWELIESAREHVLRAQTDAAYLAEHGGSDTAAEKLIGRILQESHVSFRKLCDEERNQGDSETIHGVEWKVYRSERGFDDLFRDYWNDIGEQWTEWMKGEKPRMPWMKRDAVTFWKLAHNKGEYPGGFKQLWKEHGQSVLASWKTNGFPRNDFLALARFRRERDNRAANLPQKKPKRKPQRLMAKARA
jgi:hypothetical protein